MALKSTKLFIIKLSKSNYAIYILCFIAYIEAIFFPIPPDLLLIPLSIINYRKIFFLAFLTTFFSVLGGFFGYFIGLMFFEQIGLPILNFLELKNHYSDLSNSYNENGVLAVLLGGFSPIPYKLIAIVSGTTNMPIFDFLWASTLSRGLRFFLLAFLIYFFKDAAYHIIKKYFSAAIIIISIIFILIIIGFKF
jgi:membrane protein YqaA with SNARE-associated domain